MQNSHAAHDLLVSKLLGDDAHVQYIQFRQMLHEHVVVVNHANVHTVSEQSLQARVRLACQWTRGCCCGGRQGFAWRRCGVTLWGRGQ